MPRTRTRPALLLALLLAVGFAPPAEADEPRDGATVPSDPVFEALRLDGTTARGRIRQLGPGGALTLDADEGEEEIPLDRLVKLTRTTGTPTLPPDGAQVVFPDGDRLRAAIGVAGEEALEVVADGLGDAATSVPLGSALGVVLNPPAGPDALRTLLDRVRSEPRDGDVLWLANGDRRVGTLLELTPQSLKFQRDDAALPFDRNAVVALGFDPKLADYPRPAGPFLELTLRDGSRLGVADARVERGALRARARFGAEVRVPLGELSRVHVLGGPVSYLADRAELAVQYEGYIGPPRPYRRDAAVTGDVLSLAGRPYDRGLGTQSRTLLAYKLDPADRRFQALVGLDDRAGDAGSVVFRVKVDGQDKFVSPPMSARDTPRAVDVDVSGAKLLILMTEFGERGEVRDYADWVEARLVR